MTRFSQLSFFILVFFTTYCSAETVIWKGEVSSDGTPTQAIPLQLHKKYQIRVSGFVNLGKWIQSGEKLANDACYEFNKETMTTKIVSFKNSNNISVCGENYHFDHVYQSNPFIAKQNKIHFWIYDTNYEDNSGSFQIEVVAIP